VIQRLAVLLLAAVLLAGCAVRTPLGGGDVLGSATGVTPSPQPVAPIGQALRGNAARGALYTVSASVVAIGNLALAYGNLPTCPQATAICKDPAIHRRIFQAYAKADGALTTAEDFIRAHPADDATTLVQAAQAALVALQIVTDENAVGATLARTQNPAQGSK